MKNEQPNFRGLKWLLLSPFILFFCFVIYFEILGFTIETKGKNEITHFLKSQNIPDDAIIMLNGEQYSIGILSITGYSETITTKSDYKIWKQNIENTGKFYNRKKVPNDYIPTPKDCELVYSFNYHASRNNLSFRYEIPSGYPTGNKKIIKENFAYPDIPFDYPEE
ncbi:hypothetical protein ACK4CS_15040 [Enterococcus gallinarum]|uniref:Uncharacterized protein n=1 Tax=Enterococcus gallinarum TaxID=1353 RepID=A0A376GZY9_ENTGA|nr:hypothetical protein [Enterococcus gallinarum]OJG47888.1 hypothetical protein RV03_GL001594 [Enterococcus gallinarum]STD73235.1 Uncharacterised protein [Enterococcus gallinarum]STD82135.1 Uncharacterised protein [Enterococcus gallinarum]